MGGSLVRSLVRSALVTALTIGPQSACSDPSVCESFDQKLVAQCAQPVPEPIEACDDGSAAACVSECGLVAECDVLLATGDVFDADYSARSELFSACVADCSTGP